MANLLVYYAHPGHRFSHINLKMSQAGQTVEGITFVDLYREYPRFEINVDREQERLRAADVVLFQFPVFWYSSPSLVKEWEDLVLEHGFAYGAGGHSLNGKRMMLAVTAAGGEEAYSPEGYQSFSLRTFLTPFEQTANLCGMSFETPYVLYGSLKAPESGEDDAHVQGYVRLLEAIRDDHYNFDKARKSETLSHTTLPLKEDA